MSAILEIEHEKKYVIIDIFSIIVSAFLSLSHFLVVRKLRMKEIKAGLTHSLRPGLNLTQN